MRLHPLERARQLVRADTLVKVPRPANTRAVFSLPYDPRLPSISQILRKKHRALLTHDADASEYMSEPPMVTYTRTKNIRDMVFRAKVPGPPRRVLRPRPPCFYSCGRRSNCVLCLHSTNRSSYTCPVTKQTVNITAHITCQN